jgi:hypothetical protein
MSVSKGSQYTSERLFALDTEPVTIVSWYGNPNKGVVYEWLGVVDESALTADDKTYGYINKI